MGHKDKKRILVVEDDEAILESVCELLQDAGYHVDRALNGKDALQTLASNEALPALIVLDLMMPIMDGYKFREIQSSDPRLALIPVLVMTADGHAEDKRLKIGAVGSLRKPLEIKTFLKTVERAIQSA